MTGMTVHVDKWRGETVLQSSYMSQMLNLGQTTERHSPQGDKKYQEKLNTYYTIIGTLTQFFVHGSFLITASPMKLHKYLYIIRIFFCAS